MALLVRGMWIVLVFAFGVFSYLVRRLTKGRLPPREVERLRGEALADILQRLGATYVKFGQILGSRPDLLEPGYVEALARLQDSVAPAPFADILRVIKEDLGPDYATKLVSIEEEPIAAASVAHVHRARLADGREVALKVQRPRACAQIDRDLALMLFVTRLFDRVPSLQLLSLPGCVEEFGVSLRGQLDFRKEAENNRRFAQNFADWPEVRVPELIEGLCTKRVLAMEFVHGVKASQPEKVGGDRKRLARIGAETVLRMVFRDGFVHADMHPGNILLTPDEKVVLIDLGMIATIPGEMIRPWVEANLALAMQDGRKAASMFYRYSPSVSTSDYPKFESEVMAFFQNLYGKSLGDVEVSEVVSGIMNILRRHGVKIDPAFTVVNVSMLVAEGLGKQLDPNLDVLELSKPYLFEALKNAPPGKPPLREPPSSAVQTAGAHAPAAA